MDELDKEIYTLLQQNARMTVKAIAQRVSLTSPAVSERIHRMERSGVIGGYTLIPGEEDAAHTINALISVSIFNDRRDAFISLMHQQSTVRQCYQVTGSHSYILKVRCADVAQLEAFINLVQEYGQTSTQIILSMPIDCTTPW